LNVLKAVLSLALPLLLVPGLAAAAPADDRQVVQRFAASGVLASRALQEDLARSSWSTAELQAALVRAYGLSTSGVAQFLGSPQGTALLQQHLTWWSPELSPQVRMAALRSAIVADSRDGALSLLGVIQALPVRFVLPRMPTGAATAMAPRGSSCACPPECGRSSLARLAFLMACLQAGATAGSAQASQP